MSWTAIRNDSYRSPKTRQVLGGIGHSMVYELIKRGEIVKVNIGQPWIYHVRIACGVHGSS